MIGWRSLVSIFALLMVFNGPNSHAQSGPQNLSERIHIRAADWQQRAKAKTDVRVGETVRLRSGSAAGRITSAPIELPFAVNGVGPHWDATVPEGAVLEVEVRTSPDGTTWGSWVPPAHRTPIPPTAEGRPKANPHAGDLAGGLVLTEPDTRFVQVRATLRRSGEASPRLRRLSLYVVNTTDGPSAPEDVDRVEPKTGDADTTKPRIYSRDEWGARAPTTDYRYHPATHLAIHHTASASAGAADTWEDCAAAVRAIQDYHMDTNGWIDIGYNYLVCQTGDLFQGREDGNDSRDVVGAHDGYNDGSVGTGGLGYFHPPEDQQPSSSLLDSFTNLFAWIAARREIDPKGTSNYFEYGSLRNVYGHRDVGATACPGDHLYPKRADIVDRLADIVSDRPEETILSENRPNPAQSVTRFNLKLSRGGIVKLTVYDLLGRRVARRNYGYFSAGQRSVSLRTAQWASGTYPYRLTVGEETATGTIRVVQ